MQKKYFLISLTFFLITSCGGDRGGSKDLPRLVPSLEPNSTDMTEVEEDNIEGTYMARFTTLNGNINGVIPGSLTFKRERGQDRLIAFLRIFAGAPGAVHPQNVYVGQSCPTIADDSNGDGYLDINEAVSKVGKILIPLDANLNSQAAGRNTYPVGDISGSYYWERVASLSRLYQDLRNTSSAYSDELYKLAPDEKLDFAGKVVIVQGISKNTELPESVGTFGKKSAQQTLPIACGVIQKIDPTSGTIENSETMSEGEPRTPRRPSSRPRPREEPNNDGQDPEPSTSAESTAG